MYPSNNYIGRSKNKRRKIPYSKEKKDMREDAFGRVPEGGDIFMLTSADLAVLNEAYRSSKMGLEAINAVISKVYDEDLALDLNRQAVRFLSFEDKVTEKIREANRRPEPASTVGKAMLWTSIQANTLLNTSTEHVADLMIQGNTRGITDLMKAVKENKGAKKEYCELAEELMDFEEHNISRLKSYLK